MKTLADSINENVELLQSAADGQKAIVIVVANAEDARFEVRLVNATYDGAHTLLAQAASLLAEGLAAQRDENAQPHSRLH